MLLLKWPLEDPQRVDLARKVRLIWPVAPAYVVEARCCSRAVPVCSCQHKHAILVHPPRAQYRAIYPLHDPHIVRPDIWSKPLRYDLRMRFARRAKDLQASIRCRPVLAKHDVVTSWAVAKVEDLGVCCI